MITLFDLAIVCVIVFVIGFLFAEDEYDDDDYDS